jgi:malonate decarboxylase gamma subunit
MTGLPKKLADTLETLFGSSFKLDLHGELAAGTAVLDNREIALVGTINGAAIGADLALALAAQVLDVVEHHPGRPILLLADNSGQKLAKRDELLGNAGYLSHLAKCLAVARARGHKSVALVYGTALSGGFMATCMACDACFAMPGTEVRVMRLDAMARITRIPQARLEDLTKTSPILKPEVDAFERLGAIEAIWQDDPAAALAAALRVPAGPDRRDASGFDRGGRQLAAENAGLVKAHRT